MNEAKVLLEIIRCFIENRECIVGQEIDEKKLYQLAVCHKVSNFLVEWAKKYAKSDEIKQLILSDYHRQIMKDTNETIELEQMLNEFEEAEIKTLVVKGVIMKAVYPQSYMRQMCDMDIMIHGDDFKKASKIMKGLGYEEYYDHEKHLVFEKMPFMIVEMHRKLIPGADVSHEYFNEIWPLCISFRDYKNIVQMTLEDSYLFCIIHLIRHFKYAGIQIRDVLDVYLFYEKYKEFFDFNKINKKLEEFKAEEFERNIRKIAYRWFGTEKIEDFDEVERFILKGASERNRIDYEVGKNEGKSQYALRLVFPEFKIMREKYPILKKAPIFLPFTWVARIFKDIFSKETTVKTRINTIKMIQDTNQEEVEYIENIYKKLGIIRKE